MNLESFGATEPLGTIDSTEINLTKEKSNDRVREYIADMILDQAKDIPKEIIEEMAEEEFQGILDNDTLEWIQDLLDRATVRVSWRDHEWVYGNFETDDDDDDGDEYEEL